MISKSILKDGVTRNTYMDESSMGVFEILYNGAVLSQSTTQVSVSSTDKIKIKLKTEDLNTYPESHNTLNVQD